MYGYVLCLLGVDDVVVIDLLVGPSNWRWMGLCVIMRVWVGWRIHNIVIGGRYGDYMMDYLSDIALLLYSLMLGVLGNEGRAVYCSECNIRYRSQDS